MAPDAAGHPRPGLETALMSAPRALSSAALLGIVVLVLLVTPSTFVVTGSKEASPPLPPGVPLQTGVGSTSTVVTPIGEVSTQDPRAAGNLGVAAVLVLPNATLSPGTNVSIFLNDPINATSSVQVGVLGTAQVSGTHWTPFYSWTADGVPSAPVYNTSDNFHIGGTVPLEVQRSDGDWWNATVLGSLIQGVGGNGTFDVGATSAEGYLNASGPGASLSLEVANYGGTELPGFQAFPALEYVSAVNVVSVITGLWSSFGGADWPVAGEDQNGAISADMVLEGQGADASPTNGSVLWGIFGPTFQPFAQVTTSSTASYPNTGIQVNVTVPAQLNVSSGDPYVFTAWDSLTPTLSVGVGVWVGLPGGGALPFGAINDSGVVERWVGDGATISPGSTTNLSATPGPHSTWDFDEWDPGVGLLAIAGNVSNGSVPAAPRDSMAASPWLEIDAFDAPLSGGSAYVFGPTLQVRVSGTWRLVEDGEVGAFQGTTGSPVEGTTQDPFLPPGSVEVDPTYALLAPATSLWGPTVLGSLTLTSSMLPSIVGTGQLVPVWSWINGTGGPAAQPIVQVSGVPGVTLSGEPAVLAAGEVLFNLTFPIAEPWVIAYNITVTAVAPGFTPVQERLTTNLTEGPLLVQGRPAHPDVQTLTNTTLWVWANSTDGSGPRSGANLSFSTLLGGTITSTGYDASMGAYQLSYTPPLVTLPSVETVFVLAHVEGFQSGGGTFSFTVEPLSLTLAFRAAPTPVLSGENATITAWVNSSSGSPLGGATFLFSLGASLLSTASVTVVGPGLYTFPVQTPWLSENETETLLVYTTDPGYRAQFQNVSVSVGLRPLSAQVSAGTLTAGLYPFTVSVTSAGAALAGATVDFSAPAGQPGSNILTTNGGGRATMSWSPPSTSGRFVLVFLISDPGYWTVSRTTTIVISGAIPGVLGVSPWLLVIIPAAIIAVFLALVAWGRRRSEKEEREVTALMKGTPPEPNEGTQEVTARGPDVPAEDPPASG